MRPKEARQLKQAAKSNVNNCVLYKLNAIDGLNTQMKNLWMTWFQRNVICTMIANVNTEVLNLRYALRRILINTSSKSNFY